MDVAKKKKREETLFNFTQQYVLHRSVLHKLKQNNNKKRKKVH